jgi:hypothetical protein
VGEKTFLDYYTDFVLGLLQRIEIAVHPAGAFDGDTPVQPPGQPALQAKQDTFGRRQGRHSPDLFSVTDDFLRAIKWISGIFRYRPLYLAAICKSDWQSDLHLADHHADSQRTHKVPSTYVYRDKSDSTYETPSL